MIYKIINQVFLFWLYFLFVKCIQLTSNTFIGLCIVCWAPLPFVVAENFGNPANNYRIFAALSKTVQPKCLRQWFMKSFDLCDIMFECAPSPIYERPQLCCFHQICNCWESIFCQLLTNISSSIPNKWYDSLEAIEPFCKPLQTEESALDETVYGMSHSWLHDRSWEKVRQYGVVFRQGGTYVAKERWK